MAVAQIPASARGPHDPLAAATLTATGSSHILGRLCRGCYGCGLTRKLRPCGRCGGSGWVLSRREQLAGLRGRG